MSLLSITGDIYRKICHRGSYLIVFMSFGGSGELCTVHGNNVNVCLACDDVLMRVKRVTD